MSKYAPVLSSICKLQIRIAKEDRKLNAKIRQCLIGKKKATPVPVPFFRNAMKTLALLHTYVAVLCQFKSSPYVPTKYVCMYVTAATDFHTVYTTFSPALKGYYSTEYT